MKTAIIAFDSLRNPTSSSVKTGGDVRKEFSRMKAAKEHMAGLPVVELWTEDQGFVARYLAEAEPTKKTIIPKFKKDK